MERLTNLSYVTVFFVEDMSFGPSLRNSAEAEFKGREGKDNFVDFEFADYKGLLFSLSFSLCFRRCLKRELQVPSMASLHAQTWPFPKRKRDSRRRFLLLLHGSKRLCSSRDFEFECALIVIVTMLTIPLTRMIPLDVLYHISISMNLLRAGHKSINHIHLYFR